jgi:hypothetical protein
LKPGVREAVRKDYIAELGYYVFFPSIITLKYL